MAVYFRRRAKSQGASLRHPSVHGLHQGRRFAAFVLLLAVATALALYAKYVFLTAFLLHGALRVALVGVFLAAAYGLFRLTQPPGVLATLVTLPLTTLLLASIVNTPLGYEMARQAEALSFPEGALEERTTEGRRVFSGYGEAAAAAYYAPDTNRTALTRAMVATLERDGWNVTSAVMPGEDVARWGELGFIDARRAPYAVTCTVDAERGDGVAEPRVAIRCALRA